MTSLMGYAGYISTTGGTITQPDSAIQMIMGIYKWGPLLVFAGYTVLLLLYKLEKRYPEIMKELEEREARGEL